LFGLSFINQSINKTLFIKHFKNTEVDQSAVQKNTTHTKHKIQIIETIEKLHKYPNINIMRQSPRKKDMNLNHCYE